MIDERILDEMLGHLEDLKKQPSGTVLDNNLHLTHETAYEMIRLARLGLWAESHGTKIMYLLNGFHPVPHRVLHDAICALTDIADEAKHEGW